MSDLDPLLAFGRETYRLGDLELGPIGADLDTLAAGVAALDPWARAGVDAAAMRRRMQRPWAATFRFALRLDGRPVGYLALRHPFMRGPYIETIALFPEAQGKGLARRIVDWMAEEIGDEGANIWLCVTEWNARARAVYAALGFVEIGPIPGLVAAEQDEIFMRLPLSAPVL